MKWTKISGEWYARIRIWELHLRLNTCSIHCCEYRIYTYSWNPESFFFSASFPCFCKYYSSNFNDRDTPNSFHSQIVRTKVTIIHVPRSSCDLEMGVGILHNSTHLLVAEHLNSFEAKTKECTILRENVRDFQVKNLSTINSSSTK